MMLPGVALIRKLFANLMPVYSGHRHTWWPLVREPFTGAWQRNQTTCAEDILTNPFVYACIRLIATDIGKLTLNLVAEDKNRIWNVTTNSAFSPVLRRPNHYQTRNEFFQSWMFSKLIHSNTYVLKQRDQRGVVSAMYVLDPSRVTVLVAPDGSVFYQLGKDDLSQQPQDSVTVPMSEIIHDKMTALYHPLVGMGPMNAAGKPASHGLKIQDNASMFFGNGSNPGGILTIEQMITEEQATRLRQQWQANYGGNNYGQVAVLGMGMKYQPTTVQARDAQLIEQWNSTAHSICTAFGVPAFKVGVGQAPTYNNVEALNQAYYSDCLQTHLEQIEALLDYGLELPKPYGTEFDVDDLIIMDGAARVEAASKAVRAGMSPNEARFKYFDLGPVKGGDTPFMQQQDWPLALLAERTAEDLVSQASQSTAAPVTTDNNMSADDAGKMLTDLLSKSLELSAA